MAAADRAGGSPHARMKRRLTALAPIPAGSRWFAAPAANCAVGSRPAGSRSRTVPCRMKDTHTGAGGDGPALRVQVRSPIPDEGVTRVPMLRSIMRSAASARSRWMCATASGATTVSTWRMCASSAE